jgi:hypothetical protein
VFLSLSLSLKLIVLVLSSPQGEEEDSRPLPQPPSQLDNLLITGRVNNYCDQINQFVGQGFSKLCMLQGLVQGQKEGKGKEDETTKTSA